MRDATDQNLLVDPPPEAARVAEPGAPEEQPEATRTLARISQVVGYLFTVIYTLLGIRLLLALVAANPEAGFTRFIAAITNPLYLPFEGVLPALTTDGGYTLALPVLLAILMYALLHGLIKALLRTIGHRPTYL